MRCSLFNYKVMGFKELGTQSTDTPKTPTLKQWIKQNPESQIHCSPVKVIFNPASFASYTFVTEQDFKVVVEKGSPLARYLEETLPDALLSGACLYIQIKDKEKGSWAVSALEGNDQDWEQLTWGWKAGAVTIHRPPKKKSTRQSVGAEQEEES